MVTNGLSGKLQTQFQSLPADYNILVVKKKEGEITSTVSKLAVIRDT
jgi:hypothetical protein